MNWLALMADVLRREFIYLWYYFSIQLEQLFPYWLLGMAIGSFISVFGREKINRLSGGLRDKNLGLFGIVPACILGIASPLCMYGTIPIGAALSAKGMRDDWLAAFMMASILLNPQLIIYSAALGTTALSVRIVSCFLCGVAAGLLVHFRYQGKAFFNFSGFSEAENRDTDPNVLPRLLKNLGRGVKATGPYFLLGIALSALFQRYVPAGAFAGLFGNNSGFGVLMAATAGVPLYACGGGTIPLLRQWLHDGMGIGPATAFMITGPATKITNLGAMKIALGMERFIQYILFSIAFAVLTGILTSLMLR